jgi:hypothetical protein
LQPHPLLLRLFVALEDQELQWVLLRIPPDFANPAGDVDLLVAAEDVHALVHVARDLGFVALPGWELPPDLMLVCYDRPSDHWIVLDVATTVSFRSPRSWELPHGAREVLSRRQVSDGVATPSDDEAFWLLLVHCLLDRGTVAHQYRGPLRELVPRSSRSYVARTVLSSAGGGWRTAAFEEAVRLGDWKALQVIGAQLAADLKRRRPLLERFRAAANDVARAARKPLLLRRRRGVSVALLGPNGVGKSTVAAGVQRGFPFGSIVVYMGLWKAAGGAPACRVAEVLTRPLRLWGRYAVAVYHQARGRLVLYDRYVYEAQLPPKPPLLALKRFYFWVLGHAIPSPDAAVVLDVAGRVAYGRKQENPPEELESERRVYALLAATEPSVVLVDAAQEPAAVRADVTAIVWRKLAARWRGGRSACDPTCG